MIYPKCPTCGTLLCDKQLKIEEELRKINNNSKLTIEQKDKEKRKLIKSFGLKYCCNMRLMSYMDIPKIVQ